MHVAFRVDASLNIGAGHVMRCLALADALYERGVHCTFICRPQPGQLMDLINQRGHQVISLPALFGSYEPTFGAPVHAAWLGADWVRDAAESSQALAQLRPDWLVVDHYALDGQWEQALRPYCKQLMVIDDLADRLHDCDILIDQNLGRFADEYRRLTPKGATLLTGTQFALLRPEFARLRPSSLLRREHPTFNRLLITMGGVDKNNMTGRVLSALDSCVFPKGFQITVVMGSKAPWLEQIRAQAVLLRWPVQVLFGVSDMATLMAESDLAIGAAGGSAWERCCLGLPTLLLVLADNQKAGATALQNIGAALVVEHVKKIGSILNKLTSCDSLEQLSSMSRAAAEVTDGEGVNRVCERLMKAYD
jgi:UDP-2,4-diacetamido-2,4,6-trideoxy-beta-L-altropyranose hydrolase